MSDISPSSIRTDAALEEALKNAASPDEMKAILADAAVAQGLVQRDYYDRTVLIPVDKASVPTKLSKSITGANGQKLFFEGDSEADIDQRILAYLREHTRSAEVQTEVQPRDESGRFTTRVDDPTAKVELELKFKRGELSTDEYLAQSGAIDSYLESQGVSLDSMRKVSDEGFEKSWEEATTEFLNGPAGSDWQGGSANLKEIGETLIAMHLDRVPSVESLERAYADMRRRSAVAENHELTATREMHERMANANSVEEIRNAASSLFGRR